jgi:SAM-dependent methyltransferase
MDDVNGAPSFFNGSGFLRGGKRALRALVYGARLPPDDPSLRDRVRGLFQEIAYSDGTLTLIGWMLLPREPLHSLSISVDQTHVCDVQMGDRLDVAQAYPFIPHALTSGFAVSIPWRLEVNGMADISVVAEIDGTAVGSMAVWYSPSVPFQIPPGHLLKRVTGSESESFFRASSFQSFRDLWPVACRWREPGSIRSMLDWGCGCGRLVNTFLHLSTVRDFNGCDIDSEAVDWCRTHFPLARFAANAPAPPTEYPDNTFDLAVGNSVMTHLTKDLQLAWLDEIRRIIRPGGLCLASVHGDFATSFCRPDPRVRFKLGKEGIFDEWKDASLTGVAPSSYYRDTLQTRAYTKKAYERYFEILEYIEGGWLKFQDLVVMRKR